MSTTNGHVSDVDADAVDDSPPVPRSESELSDLNDIPPSRSEPQEQEASDDDAMHDMATSEIDEDEDAPGEVDADYDAETPPPEPSAVMRHARSMSEDSLRPGKRKSDVDDEEYMKQNPELYGLRRSVRIISPASPLTALILPPAGTSATNTSSGTCTCIVTTIMLR
jgi:chromodomain-helicase-DNA-binding protein 1